VPRGNGGSGLILKKLIYWDQSFWGISENSVLKWKISEDLKSLE
jgi:hypothetical protein